MDTLEKTEIMTPIIIEDVVGKTTNTLVNPNSTIQDLKAIIYDKTGIPAQYQMLSLNGECLSDSKLIKHYPIESFATITLYMNLKGGALAEQFALYCNCDCCVTRNDEATYTITPPPCCGWCPCYYCCIRPCLCCGYCLWISLCPCCTDDNNCDCCCPDREEQKALLDTDKKTLPDDIVVNWDEYNRLLMSIQWKDVGSVCVRNIEEGTTMFDIVIKICNATNNVPCKIRNKEKLLEMCPFTIIELAYIDEYTL